MSQTDKEYIKSLLSAKPKSESFFFKKEINAGRRSGSVTRKWGVGIYFSLSPDVSFGIELNYGSRKCRVGASFS
jgi:hypothetical protein